MNAWDKLFAEKLKEVIHHKHEKSVYARMSPTANGNCAREQIAEEYYKQADIIYSHMELITELRKELEKTRKEVLMWENADVPVEVMADLVEELERRGFITK